MSIIGAFLLLVSIGLFVIMMVQHNRGTVHLISLRNVFLLGFIHFQLLSVFFWVFYPDIHKQWTVHYPLKTLLQFTGMALLYLAVLLFVYQKGWIAAPLARWTGKIIHPKAPPSATSLVVLAFILTGLAITLRFGIPIPLVVFVAIYVGAGLSATAVGIIVWSWIGLAINPILFTLSIIAVLANSLFLMVGFSRRALISVGLVILWSAFYRKWRNYRSGAIAVRSILLIFGPLFILAIFNSIRMHRPESLNDVLRLLPSANQMYGWVDTFRPQDTGPVTLWIIENYPEEFERRHMFNAWYYFGHFVPRSWWEDKPTSLGDLVPDQADIPGRGGMNVGAGMIGHAEAEGGWYAVIVYAILCALALRLGDEMARVHSNNLFIVLPIGAALGEVLGVPRGEAGWMAGIATLGMLGSLIVMLIFRKLVPEGPQEYPANELEYRS